MGLVFNESWVTGVVGCACGVGEEVSDNVELVSNAIRPFFAVVEGILVPILILRT